MTAIDVEKFLQWVFREELPKGKPVSASAWDAIASFGALGTRVGVSRGPRDGLGFVPGAPHADAELAGAIVRDLPRDFQLADDGALADLLGAYAALDPVAPARVLATGFNVAALVMHYAVMGTRPQWDVGVPRCARMMMRGAGRPRVVVVGERDGETVPVVPDRSGRYRAEAVSGLRCPLQWVEPSIWDIAEARAEYAAWHAGLCMVATALSGGLADHAVTGPALPALPWRDGMPPSPRVLAGTAGAHDVARALPLAPRRPAPLPPLKSDIERAAFAARARRMREGKNIKA